MRKDEEDEMIGKFTQEAWGMWVKAGWLEGLQKEFGRLSEKEAVIFENGWKLGTRIRLK
jgi:hypothetical protein